MPKLILLLAASVALACAAPVRSATNDHPDQAALPADSAPLPAADLDLSGVWATGSVGEPDARRLVLTLQCNYTPPLWIIEQRGDTVRAFTIPASWAQGVASPPPVRQVTAQGRRSGVAVTMSTNGTRYVLRYDSTSGHLRGTLNGAPFWAVRQDVVHPKDCIAVP